MDIIGFVLTLKIDNKMNRNIKRYLYGSNRRWDKYNNLALTMVIVGSIIGFYTFPLLKAFAVLYNTILIISIFPFIVF